MLLTRTSLRGVALTVLLITGLSVSPAGAQSTVALITDVQMIDTASGQDIEILSSAPPSNFEPKRIDGCTFALLVPDLVPAAEIGVQFFSSDLVERLTVRAAAGGSAAAEICVKATVAVRSQVALRASGLVLRLVRVDTGVVASEPGESFRPADEATVKRAALPQSAVNTAATPVAPASTRSEQPSTRNSSRRSEDRRELELAMREARVEKRELQLEVGELRRQLAAQVAANAVLDQRLASNQGATDQLTPRIDRLVDVVGLSTAGLEQPVERFDAVLATLERRLTDQSVTAAELQAIETAQADLIEVLERGVTGLLITNDDVNVRLGPSTQDVRVAFLPRGVLVLSKSSLNGWNLVSAGSFEGWIFGELLSPYDSDSSQLNSTPTDAPQGGTAERLNWARSSVEGLVHELALIAARLDREDERAALLEGELASVRSSVSSAERARVAATDEQDHSTRSLEAQVRDLSASVEALQADKSALETELQAVDTRRAAEVSRLEADLEQANAQLDSTAQGALADSQGATRSDLDPALRARERLQALASLMPGPNSIVRITDQTNLRRGPGVENERLALLPTGFEAVLLKSQDGWYQVVYGSLSGWVSGEYAQVQAPALDTAGTDRVPLSERSLEQLLAHLEQALVASNVLPPQAAAAQDSTPDVGDENALFGQALQVVASTLYACQDAWNRADVESYLGCYSDQFTPQTESRDDWEKRVRRDLEGEENPDVRIQDLSLRRVSQSLVEAQYKTATGPDGALIGAGQRRVDLALEGQQWKILLMTTEVDGSELE